MHFLVPEWYSSAKERGASGAELKSLIKDFAQKSSHNKQESFLVDDATVELTYDMYESCCNKA